MNKSVLIVDDDPIIRLIIQEMVRNIDRSIICHQCENGEEGLAVLETLQNAAGFVSVLLDINMPILNGWGFLDGLRKVNLDSFIKFQLYIVTSSIDESDMLKAQSYPLIRKFYHKPLSRQDISEMLNSDVLI